jgi:hypothetical protein
MKKIIIITALLLTALVPSNVQTKIATNSVPFVYESHSIPFLYQFDELDNSPQEKPKTDKKLLPEKENKQTQTTKQLPKKHKQEIVKIETKIIPQTEVKTVIEIKEVVIVDDIEGDVARIEFINRTTKDIPLNELPSGITRSMALVLDNGIYTISVEETNKRKAIIEEKMKDMFI